MFQQHHQRRPTTAVYPEALQSAYFTYSLFFSDSLQYFPSINEFTSKFDVYVFRYASTVVATFISSQQLYIRFKTKVDKAMLYNTQIKI
jgi:hypothetical protein